jgi:succinate dehydrogenase / fumarate reductase membrane anchor subunit
MADSKITIDIMRSQLGRARGLGAARAGAHHWWVQRLTSIALVPLTLWFVFAVVGHLGAGQLDMALWIGQPINTVLLLCLVVATFHHMQLGLQVVIEDYCHTDAVRVTALLAIKAVTALLGLACVVAVLKLAFLKVG